MKTCAHKDQMKIALPIDADKDGAVCEECVKAGGRWVHLRQCLICGKVKFPDGVE